MAKYFILSLLLVIVSTLSIGQKIGDYYIGIPSDSTLDCRLRFLSDSTVELSNVPRHMSGRLAIIFKYITTDTTIEILPGLVAKEDSLSLSAFGLNFSSPIIKLTKIKRGFIDYNRSLIYVRQKDFGNNPDIAYIINGKTFMQDAEVSDYLGIVKKRPKTNKALQKKLKSLNKDNCTIEIVKGLDAYKRFGIKTVYGAIVINTKQ
jgi:hypothetical protein